MLDELSCQSAAPVREGRYLCGEPALFLYTGVKYPFSLGGSMLLCMGCARRKLLSVEPAFASGYVRMIIYRHPRSTIMCSNCGQLQRLVQEYPTVVNTRPRYCSWCGSQDILVSENADRDWWDLLSEGLGYPLALVRLLFSEWVPEDHPVFKDYVTQRLEEVRSSTDADDT